MESLQQPTVQETVPNPEVSPEQIKAAEKAYAVLQELQGQTFKSKNEVEPFVATYQESIAGFDEDTLITHNLVSVPGRVN